MTALKEFFRPLIFLCRQRALAVAKRDLGFCLHHGLISAAALRLSAGECCGQFAGVKTRQNAFLLDEIPFLGEYLHDTTWQLCRNIDLFGFDPAIGDSDAG